MHERTMWWLTMMAAAAATTAAAGSPTEHYRVLILSPLASRSQYHLCSSLAEALGGAGHDVTLVTSFNSKSSSKHAVRHVHTGANNSMLEEMNLFELHDNPSNTFSVFVEVFRIIGRQMWEKENIKQLWRERNTFHAIVIISYINEMATPFLLDYQGVYISLCTPGIEIRTFSNQANWLPFSVVPSIFTDFTQQMTFLERAINPLNYLLHCISYSLTMLPAAQNLLQEFFPDMPPLRTLYSNSSLTLINGHFSIDGQVPLLPTQVEIGTINTKRPETLPQDLKEFVEGAGEDGVVLFSLGSIAKSTHIPQRYKDILVEAFRRLPQRVVWKYEGDDLQLPPNVLAKAWVPQQDLLGHNRTRLFISHCGNLGLQEAQYHGVPVLALPLAFDQPRNAHRMAKNGYGLVLHWNELSVEALLEAVNTLLYNPKYREKLQAVSQALQDQKETPAERAIWWVEYAIRHKGAPYMVYAGKRLHYLQYVMADVVVFWLTVLVSWLLLSVYCLRRCIQWCTNPHRHDSKHKKFN
ncbi:UDP-glucosyltransferase 2-like [Eriocheir sinensis]|uniref:UDP-glucosyltransferase 2-like n=1 Tax=Eriocheir sinensis TaxID=95602 RepID=UPI0021C6D019|nr:UDP-glucosyltransferase 2-like [Eriocheir sinensis]